MRVWIDVENAPQARFFLPLLAALRRRGAEIFVTVRDYGEAIALLEAAGEVFTVVGGPGGTSRLARTAAVAGRAAALARLASGWQINVAASHGVRPHLAAASTIGVPCVTGYDYEHASKFLVHRLACEVLVPRVLVDRYLRPAGQDLRKVTAYDGFKEELYLSELVPDDSIYAQLALDPARPLAVVRPPSFHAHYASSEGNALFFDVVRVLRRRSGMQLVITARDAAQRMMLAEECRGDPGVIVPDRPLDGLNLIWHSDVVISGGGTMGREAALLGVPALSIFRGKPGVVDAHLEESGRLRRIQTAAELGEIAATPSRRGRVVPPARTDLVDFIVDRIINHA